MSPRTMSTPAWFILRSPMASMSSEESTAVTWNPLIAMGTAIRPLASAQFEDSLGGSGEFPEHLDVVGEGAEIEVVPGRDRTQGLYLVIG